ncbi:MAG: hypothetical protein ACYDD7_04760, partial [Acidimicrobiales bacterium]
ESWRDAALIGVLMNIRGLTELVILDVGLQLGVITGTVFTAMVLMALLTTLGATPALALVLRTGGRPGPRSRGDCREPATAGRIRPRLPWSSEADPSAIGVAGERGAMRAPHVAESPVATDLP